MFKSKLLQLAILLCLFTAVNAQNWKPTPNDTLHSISIAKDGQITLRIYAPDAEEVMIGGTDIPDNLRKKLTKLENGVWEVTTGPFEPGAYRYNFIVDKVQVMDPKNPAVSESNGNSWSLLYVPGADFMELKNVAHGTVSEVTYFSKSLNRFRRMHVYTPAGYESGKNRYPVFYLLHGAFDCDDSWSSIGRAGIILDNLIAEKKAVPMVVVMPAGHTGPFSFNTRRDTSKPIVDEFLEDFNKDIRPYIESNYRVYTDRKNRAMAGLSMGGMHTLNIAIPHLKDYSYIGVFSSGAFDWTNQKQSWEQRNLKILDDKELKKDLKLVWFATGKDDFLLQTTHNTVETMKKHGFDVTYKETAGGHTWANWREYLNEFAQYLFKEVNL